MTRTSLLVVALIGSFAGISGGGRQSAPAGMSDDYVTVNGVRLHYVSAGKGPLILFLHGFPEFWYAWKDQLAEFGKDHLAVAPDLRGYNLSDKPADVDQYRMSALVEDVRGLAEHFSREKKFILVGHDWGGAVAWAFAIAHPEYLEKLVIVNAPHPGIFGRLLASDPQQQNASQYMLMFRRPQAEQTLADSNYTTLVIWGEKDTALLTKNLDGLDQFVPQLMIKRVADGSHWVIHEKPAEVNGYIRAFIH